VSEIQANLNSDAPKARSTVLMSREPAVRPDAEPHASQERTVQERAPRDPSEGAAVHRRRSEPDASPAASVRVAMKLYLLARSGVSVTVFFRGHGHRCSTGPLNEWPRHQRVLTRRDVADHERAVLRRDRVVTGCRPRRAPAHPAMRAAFESDDSGLVEALPDLLLFLMDPG